MEENILKTAIELQKVIEETLINYPSGMCFLIGHCLAEVYKKQGFNSKKVTGSQALLMKGKSGKFIKYGKLKTKGVQVGNYHTWCEVEIDGKTFVIDASLKYNLKYLKQVLHFKTQKNFSQVLLTDKHITFYYRYSSDISLDSQSLRFLKEIDVKFIDFIIEETLKRVNFLSNNQCA